MCIRKCCKHKGTLIRPRNVCEVYCIPPDAIDDTSYRASYPLQAKGVRSWTKDTHHFVGQSTKKVNSLDCGKRGYWKMNLYIWWKQIAYSILLLSCFVHCTCAQALCQDGAVRLRGGQSNAEGRVEICFDNRWGTVCDDLWTSRDGNVVCKELGFSPTGAVTSSFSFFGRGTGPIWLDNVECSGNETRLVFCPNIGVGNHNCDHTEEAGVICQSCANGDIRLRGGISDTEGRVEICYNSMWGTVCDNMWGPTNAGVACTQLGFSSTGATPFSLAFFGQGTGSIWLDNVMCTGSETKLYDCQNAGIGVHNCDHDEDAGIRCQLALCQDGSVRLRDGQSSTEGRVEICFDNRWGTVCDNLWSHSDGDVVCQQLGFSPSGAVIHFAATFGQGSGPIWLDNVQCSGIESQLVNCRSNRVGYHNCDHSRDAGLTCQICANGDIRLRGGVSGTEGRVEVCYNSTWGTVCDNMWGPTNAGVACTQLGFSSTGAAAFSFFGETSRPTWLDNVVCMGNETRLYDCQYAEIGVHNCSHAGVRCQLLCQDGDIRLRGGRNSSEGRVEICFNNQWGTICDASNSWSNSDGNVVCKELGFSPSGAVVRSLAFFGRGDGPAWLDDVHCSGTESRLVNCLSNRVGYHNCDHSEDAGVTCQICANGDIRLRGGMNDTEGRVEICYNSTWGTVCDNMWGPTNAGVACRQLGFSSTGATPFSLAFFGQGAGPIWLDNIVCTGSETKLYDCQNAGTGVHNCNHDEDAGVRCQIEFICQDGDVRLRGGRIPTEGRVEICFNNWWGTVCDNLWDAADAQVACSQLGFSSKGAIALTLATFGEDIKPIFLDEVTCKGNESKLTDCQHQGIAFHYCSHHEDAGVVCPGPVERCNESRNSTVQSEEESYRFGGICQPYQGGSTLCDGEFDETINVHTSRNVQSQEVLTSTLNNVISFSSFDTVSSHCQNLIRSVLCLHYYTPCGLDAALVSICPEECFYVQNSCSQIWNDLERLLKVSGTDLRFINCSNPGEILDPLPHCCVDAGITIDTANSVPTTDAASVAAGVTHCPVERCNESRNSTVQSEEESYRFGGICQPYRGGSTLCDGEFDETINVHTSRNVQSQEVLTSTLNNVISFSSFDTVSSHCQNLIRSVLCLHYYTPCGLDAALVSICPEECFYVQNSCSQIWNDLERLLKVSGTDLRFINCSNPGEILDPLPHCCVDAGITIDTANSVPTTDAASVATGVTITLLLLLVVMVAAIVGLLWVKRKRRMKAAAVNTPPESLSWARRKEYIVGGDGMHEPEKKSSLKAELTISNQYNPQMRERKLTPVMSEQMRELTGKMLIPSSRIRLLDTIGHGEFGIVYKAHLLPQLKLDSKSSCCPLPQTVAVKTLKGYFGGEEIDNMMSESIKMKHFDHPNVISLIGVCIDAGPAPYIIMPFMGNGSLLSYLKKHRTDLMPPDTADEETVSDITKKLISMCLQIAKGMEYLAEQKFVHRDLAARNCMIDLHDVIKVSDFGLTEDLYARNYYRQAKEDGVVKLPVKWMSLESLNDGVFTEKTDVWSFGITCWEIFSGGKNPYPGVDLFTLVQVLENGRRLDKPLNTACSDTMYEVMLKCWQANADERPPFSELVELVSTDLERHAGYLQFSFSTDDFSPKDNKEKSLPLPSPTSASPPQIVVTPSDSDMEAS